MVEVFKTNVSNWNQANQLIRQIHQIFPGYRANFDLEDCDNILRVACSKEDVLSARLILFIQDTGYHAEVLQEDREEIEKL